MKARYADMIERAPQREETRTPEEIISGIKDKLAKMKEAQAEE